MLNTHKAKGAKGSRVHNNICIYYCRRYLEIKEEHSLVKKKYSLET